jgi:hypothetical protein
MADWLILLISEIVACETCVPSICLLFPIPGLTVVTGRPEFRIMKVWCLPERVRKVPDDGVACPVCFGRLLLHHA